jgi:hypothetical protein
MRQPPVRSFSIPIKIWSNRTSVGKGDMGPYSSAWLGSGVGIRSCSELQEELAPSSSSFWTGLGSVMHSRMKEMPFDVILKTRKLIRGFG